MENIKKLYTSAGKFDDKNQYKAILEAETVSNTERFTDNIPMSNGTYATLRNPITRKSLHLFTEVFHVKNQTDVRRVGDAKSKIKEIRAGSMLWSSIKNRRANKK